MRLVATLLQAWQAEPATVPMRRLDIMPIRGISQPAMKVPPSAIQKPKTLVTVAMSVFVNPWCLNSGTAIARWNIRITLGSSSMNPSIVETFSLSAACAARYDSSPVPCSCSAVRDIVSGAIAATTSAKNISK